MYQINYDRPVHVHFIGIGGISMSGLAAVLLQRGFTVSGSDAHESPLTVWLDGLGASVSYPQSAGNIHDDIDVVVYTAAIHPDNPEYQAAKEKEIPMLTRAELLGQLMNNYGSSIAVSGTHGKTTTTSMLSHIMMQCGLDPTISVGGILPSIGGNVRIGASDYFLTEACEYTNSFLSLFPTMGIVLNIDADHLDFFKDLDDIRHSFRRFCEQIPAGGALVINAEIPRLDELTQGLSCRVVTYGVGCGDYQAVNISYNELGAGSFDLQKGDDILGHFTLSVPGRHNVANACAALAAGFLLDLPADRMAEGLIEFKGTDRRFQKKGEIGGVTIIDDYAHHPTEIRVTLEAAKKLPYRRVWCVFQPHTYSRTRTLWKEFTEAFDDTDELILTHIYAAREQFDGVTRPEALAEDIKKRGVSVSYIDDFSDIADFLKSNVKEGDIVFTMGAGDVVNINDLITE